MDKTIPNGSLLQPLIEKVEFNNWHLASDSKLEKEYHVEYKNHIIYSFGELWPTLEHFSKAVKNGKIISLTKEIDFTIHNRSNTKDMYQLLDLISSYRSWPEFRNMETTKDMIMRFKDNKPLTMPIVLSTSKKLFLMSGNTKLDLAFMMGIEPKVVVIKI